jgi:chromate reductase
MSIRIAGTCGSLRQGSFSRGLLRAALESAPAAMEIALFDRLGDIPPYNENVFAVVFQGALNAIDTDKGHRVLSTAT